MNHENLSVIAVLSGDKYLLAPKDADPKDRNPMGIVFWMKDGIYMNAKVGSVLKFAGGYSKPFESDPAPVLEALSYATEKKAAERP